MANMTIRLICYPPRVWGDSGRMIENQIERELGEL